MTTNEKIERLEYLQDYVHVCEQEEMQQVIEEIENLKLELDGGNEMKKEFVICMVSYEEKEGMYYDLEVEIDKFDKEEVYKSISNHYSKLGIEEYKIADFWVNGENTDELNKLMLKGLYSNSNLFSFLCWLEECKGISDEDVLKALVYESETGEDIRELIEEGKHEDVVKVSDPRLYLLEETTETELPQWVRPLVFQMSDVEAMNFINVNEIANMVQYESEFYIVY